MKIELTQKPRQGNNLVISRHHGESLRLTREVHGYSLSLPDNIVEHFVATMGSEFKDAADLPPDDVALLISAAILEQAKTQHTTIATAESCTAGGIAEDLTYFGGSSAVFRGGVVAYHNAVKQGVLGVSAEILNRFGAVSLQCADAMALGALKLIDAELGVAVTGIAGPGGATETKMVGLVYISVARRLGDDDIALASGIKWQFSGSRKRVRALTRIGAMLQLLEQMNNS